MATSLRVLALARAGAAAIALLGVPGTTLGQERDGGSRAERADPRKVPGHCPTCGAANPAPRCPTCGAPIHTPAPADVRGPREPEDDRIDRRMREALRREYGEPGGPLPPAPPRPPPEPPAPPAPPPPPPHKDEDEGEISKHLKAMVGHWSAGIFDVRVASKRNGFGTGEAFYLDEQAAPDLGRAETQIYKLGIDFMKHLGIQGSFRMATYRDHDFAKRDVDFAGVLFQQGAGISTKFETRIADFDVVVHAINEKIGTFDVTVGGRYVYANTRLRDDQNLGINAEQSHEAVLPMVGLGFALRPIQELELFTSARAGGWAIESQRYGRYGRHGHHHDLSHRAQRFAHATSIEAEVGLKLTFGDLIGVVGGYRLEIVSLLYETSSDRKRTEFKQEGPFAGVIVQF